MGGGVGAPRCTNGMPLFAGARAGCNQIYRAARGNESQIKTVRFWESFLKRDENAMIHAELNWKGDSFQTVHTSVMVDIGHRSIRDGGQMRYGGQCNKLEMYVQKLYRTATRF